MLSRLPCARRSLVCSGLVRAGFRVLSGAAHKAVHVTCGAGPQHLLHQPHVTARRYRTDAVPNALRASHHLLRPMQCGSTLCFQPRCRTRQSAAAHAAAPAGFMLPLHPVLYQLTCKNFACASLRPLRQTRRAAQRLLLLTLSSFKRSRRGRLSAFAAPHGAAPGLPAMPCCIESEYSPARCTRKFYDVGCRSRTQYAIVLCVS